jgi:hypothetical protein
MSSFSIHFQYLLFVIIFSASVLSSCNKRNAIRSPEKEVWVDLLHPSQRSKWIKKIAGEALNDDELSTINFSDTLLCISYDKYKKWGNKFGHVFYEEKLSHYIIECEYNIYGRSVEDAPKWAKLNSGIMLHAQSPQSMTFGQWFPISLEMQLLACDNSTKNPTGNLCTPGTIVDVDGKLRYDHCMNSISPMFNKDQWVKARAEVYGDSIVHHIINGQRVFTYSRLKTKNEGLIGLDDEEGKLLLQSIDLKPLSEGYIAFQAESQEVKFRNIKLLNLCGCKDPKAKNHKSYYVKSDRTKCIY